MGTTGPSRMVCVFTLKKFIADVSRSFYLVQIGTLVKLWSDFDGKNKTEKW